MAYNKIIRNILKKIGQFIVLVISMAGYVPKNATILRTTVILSSLVFSLYLSRYQPLNSNLAIVYFIISEISYLGFISVVLAKNGLRHWFIKRWGDENKGYQAYETVLGFLFFHNGVSIGYIASSTPDTLFNLANKGLIFIIIPLIFICGFTIKIWAAKVVTINIYYWKDMFLGRKICEFIVTGPYKYFSNPMYGIGQLPAYATAIWYGSKHGLIAAFVNQFLIFSFYFLVEKKFIKRTYQNNAIQPVTSD
jgi:protein-S-isoprenylcysteine O-methyltransferase Ste14